MVHWRTICRIAALQALEFVGWGHPARWLPAILVWAATTAVFFFAFRDGSEVVMSMEWAISALVAAIALFAVVWFVEVLLTVPRLATEKDALFEKELEPLKLKLSAISGSVTEAQAAWERISTLEREAAELRSKLTDRNSDDQRLERIRSALAQCADTAPHFTPGTYDPAAVNAWWQAAFSTVQTLAFRVVGQLGQKPQDFASFSLAVARLRSIAAGLRKQDLT